MKEVKTAHGYIAILADFITYDQYIELQRAWTDNAKFNPETGKQTFAEISASVLYDVQKKAVSYVVKDIKDPNGVIMARQPQELPVPPLDGQEIMEAVNAVTNEGMEAFGKKKAMTSSLEPSKAITTAPTSTLTTS